MGFGKIWGSAADFDACDFRRGQAQATTTSRRWRRSRATSSTQLWTTTSWQWPATPTPTRRSSTITACWSARTPTVRCTEWRVTVAQPTGSWHCRWPRKAPSSSSLLGRQFAPSSVFFNRATLCVSAVIAVPPVCPSFCPSVTLVYCIHTAEDVKFFHQPGSPITLVFWPLRRYPIPREPLQLGRKIHGVGKFAIIDWNRHLSR